VELPRLPFLDAGSTANAQGIASGESADEDLFIRKLGDLPPGALTQVQEALRFAVGLDATST